LEKLETKGKMKATIQLTALLLVIISAPMSISCKEDNEETPKAKTKTELLTAGPWKRTGLTSYPAYDWNANGVSDTDVLSIMFPCERDNFDAYLTTGIFESNEGPTKCNEDDPQTWAETWKLIGNEIFYVGPDYNYNYTLVEVTETTLELSATFEEEGVTYTQEETYSH
jgi:hypothetical protein